MAALDWMMLFTAENMGTLMSFFGLLATIVIACVGFSISKNQLRISAREMLLKSYDDIVLAQSNIIRDGSVKGETLFLFKRALARARLGFPKKLQNYIEKLSKEADEVFQIDLLDPPEKATKARIKYDLIVKFIHEEPYKAFAPYMRLGL